MCSSNIRYCVFAVSNNRGNLSALVIFLIAALTDKLDGYIARKHNLITAFGTFLDPLADKLLVIGALVCFNNLQLVNPYIVIIIIFRELIITSFRIIAIGSGVTLSADKWGKAKTIIQILACSVVMASILFVDLGIYGMMLMYLATIVTILSGTNYILKNKHCFSSNL